MIVFCALAACCARLTLRRAACDCLVDGIAITSLPNEDAFLTTCTR